MAKAPKRRPDQNRPAIDRPACAPVWLLRLLLAVLVLIVPTYFFLRETTPESWVVSAVSMVLGAVTALWGAVILIALGLDRRDQFVERVKAIFRRALGMRWLVATSLVALAAAEVLLIYELVGARALAIPAEVSVDVLLNDEVDKVVLLGSLKAGACDDVDAPRVRVPIGRHILVFRSRVSGEPIGFHEVEVPPFWRGDPASIPCVQGGQDVSILE